MNHTALWRADHDHAAALENNLGCTAVYQRYNTGRRVSHSGHDFAA